MEEVREIVQERPQMSRVVGPREKCTEVHD